MKPAQIYTYTVPASGSVRLMVEGSFIKILASTGPVQIGGDFGNLGPVLAGQGLRDTPSKSYTITDLSGSINVVRVLIADTGFIDDRISGEVSVIDGEKARTIAGGQFAGTQSVTAAAAQFANVQLWNPAGSGKNIIVSALDFLTTVTASVLMAMTQTVLANAGTLAPANKKPGGAAPAGLLKFESKVAADPYTFGVLRNDTTAANVVIPWNIKGALVIPPGYGLNLLTTVPQIVLVANFEFFEESLT